MILYYDDSHAGNGKTTRAIERAIRRGGSTIYAVERVEFFNEIRQSIARIAQDMGEPSPSISSISSADGASQTVRQRIEGLSAYGHSQSHIVLVTHTGLKSCNLTGLMDWHLVVDEVPALVEVLDVQTPVSASTLSQIYTLEPIGDGWSSVSLKEGFQDLGSGAVEGDDFAKGMTQFHQMVRSSLASRSILQVRLDNWDDAKKQRWFAANVYSFWNFENFTSVELLGNGYTSSVDAALAKILDNKIAAARGEAPPTWHSLNAGAPSSNGVTPRRVAVCYFQEGIATSAQMFSDAGVRNLHRIGSHLGQVLPPSAIWSANTAMHKGKSATGILELNIKARKLNPRVAGSNLYRDAHDAAFIYCANPSPSTTAFLKRHRLSASDWRDTKEHEAALQFITRTSLRDPRSTHPVRAYVLDRTDAEYVGKYAEGLGHDVTLEFIDLELEASEDGRKSNGRQLIDLGDEALAQRKERERELARNRQRRRRAIMKQAA